MRSIVLKALILIIAFSPVASLHAAKGQFNYIGTLGVAKAFSKRVWVEDLSLGFGAYNMIDYQALDWAAIGIGFGVFSYSGEVRSMKLDSVDIAGRLLPFKEKAGSSVRPYLVGGMGVRPIWKNLDETWPGNFHGFAGMGFKFDFDKQPGGSGLDIQAIYEYYTPVKSNMNTIGLRVGYSFTFGKAKETSESKPRVDAAVAAVVTPVAVRTTAPVTSYALQTSSYTVVEGDTYWKIACRSSVYGDCEMYPLLVLANKDTVRKPEDLKPGVVIQVQRNITDKTKAAARSSAWRDDYTKWRGTNVTKSKYDEWKAKRQEQHSPAR
jgi:hypothetical protein